jgi:hypothetical protein
VNESQTRDPARDVLQLETLGSNAFVVTLLGFAAFVCACCSILAE